jgi:hypothetical protein
LNIDWNFEQQMFLSKRQLLSIQSLFPCFIVPLHDE